MKSAEVRQKFLDFFRGKDHRIVASAPIVNKDDPTLMFTNAGMNPFKDIFTGHKPAPFPRVANTQKCLRVSGKHNDLEEVGYDTYHHTMFEMLGNWSFGDYFKAEAIAWAWEFLTQVLGVDKNRLYATCFCGADGIPKDEEAADIWRRFLPEDRILFFSKKDNFWEMGDTGPCGPCTEIHIDLRSDDDRAVLPGHRLVNQGHWQVVEIWNVVFIQYNRKADATLEPLALKSVDTGMGFERLCMVLQNQKSTYDTDVFAPLFDFIRDEYGIGYSGTSEMCDVALRVAVDHIRAVAFTIADGQVPSNTGAGYVVRRLLRRASRYAFRFLDIQKPFLYRMVDVLAEQFKNVFPELHAQKNFVQTVVEHEELGFLHKLFRGSQLFEDYALRRSSLTVDGDFAFELYDTYGFPLDLTELMARERGMTVDVQGFHARMHQQRERSRAAGKVQAGDWMDVTDASVHSRFVGYDHDTFPVEIVKLRTVKTAKGTTHHAVLSATPFYAESGGQVGDVGTLSSGDETLRVLDTVKENELIVHVLDRWPVRAEGTWTAQIDAVRRAAIRANHSATHLMHAALRQVLGTHVEQRGSLVTDGYLRFDFSHFQKVGDQELKAVAALVNERIAAGTRFEVLSEVPLAEAKAMGAMALFGEKYGERVRVVRTDDGFSTELCGGTHVASAYEIRHFLFTAETAVSAGVRRVEALTGRAAIEFLEEKLERFEAVRGLLKAPKDVEKTLRDLLDRQAQLEAKIAAVRNAEIIALRDRLLTQTETIKDFRAVFAVVDLQSPDELKQLSWELRKNASNTLFVLGAETDGKAHLSVMATEDLDRVDAIDLIKIMGPVVKGGGGGQKHYATAGGKEPQNLRKALDEARKALAG
jgi:alanyl-tRNA synthetase